jgi:hypothetical protein
LTLRIHHGSRGTGTGAPRAIRATVVITLAVTSFRPILGNKHAPECKDKQTRKRKIRKQRINHHRNAAVKKKLRVQEDVYEALEVRESEKIKEVLESAATFEDLEGLLSKEWRKRHMT